MLNSEVPPNWRAVAAEIGVPHHQIQHFSTNIETATKEMLHYWGTSNEATLDRLYKALRKIGRDDACTFLEEKVELESTSVETIV
jgi:asparagine synthetase B (glutamine-hydrolysing)